MITDDYLPQWMKTTGDILVGIATVIGFMTTVLVAITLVCLIWYLCGAVLYSMFIEGA